MDWKRFAIGISLFVAAYLLRKLDKWLYGNPKSYQDMNGYGKIVNSWITIVFLIIAGVVNILLSLPSEI